MIERVAEALWEADYHAGVWNHVNQELVRRHWADPGLSEGFRGRYRDRARTAIAAMERAEGRG